MTLETKKITYEEYLAMPETKKRYDIVDGVMIMAPSPNLKHQDIVGELYFLLRLFLMENRVGRVVLSPMDVVVQRTPLRTRQPDVLFVSAERENIMADIVEGGPDLVVEILSPSNTRGQTDEKLTDYANISVRECWLVSPEAQTVEILSLEDGEWQRVSLSGVGDKINSNVLEGFDVEVSQLFETR